MPGVFKGASVRLHGEERTHLRFVTIIYRGLSMNPDAIGLIRAALAYKAANIQHAGQAYVRDQASRSKSAFVSYLFGACFFLGAAIFAIVAVLIGAAALFRFIEMRYGLFEAFGAAGGAMVVVALICLAIGVTKMNIKSAHCATGQSRSCRGAFTSDHEGERPRRCGGFGRSEAPLHDLWTSISRNPLKLFSFAPEISGSEAPSFNGPHRPDRDDWFPAHRLVKAKCIGLKELAFLPI